MWIAYAFGSAIFAGLTGILAKLGMRNMDSHLATAIRTIVVLFFSWLMVFVTGAQADISHLTANTIIFLVLSGGATGASWLCYFRALQIGDINKVTPIDKSSTVLTMLLSILLLGETVSAIKVVCMLLIGGGTYLMIQKKENQEGQAEQRGWLLYACGSAVFASLTAILGKVGVQNINSNLGTAIRTIVVLIMAWVIVCMQGKQKEIKNIDKKDGCFLLLSGIATGASWLCYYRALQMGDVSIVVPIDKLSILVTILFSYIVFQETLSKKEWLGLALLVGGTLLLLL